LQRTCHVPAQSHQQLQALMQSWDCTFARFASLQVLSAKRNYAQFQHTKHQIALFFRKSSSRSESGVCPYDAFKSLDFFFSRLVTERPSEL
jgi:hypothetical protein